MDNGGFPDLSGVIGSLLANPEALQGVISTVAGLKNAGLFDGLMPFAPAEGEGRSGQEEALGSAERTEAATPTSSAGGQETGAYREQDGAYTEKNGANASESRNRSSPPPSFLPPWEKNGGQNNSFSLSAPYAPRGEQDRRRDLLLALRPYLCDERQERLDGILKILGLLEMAKQLGMGFGGGEQEGSR